MNVETVNGFCQVLYVISREAPERGFIMLAFIMVRQLPLQPPPFRVHP